MDDKTILLQLCAQAPSAEIRNCIRLYNPEHQEKQLKILFNKPRVGELIATLDYLKAPNLRPNLNDYTKQGLVMNVICRIENLLPDKCNICEEMYCTKIDDQSLLPCEKCGQEPHEECLTAMLGNIEILNAETVCEAANPLALPGWTYICHACKAGYIPTKNLDVKTTILRREVPEEPQQEVQADENDRPDQPHPVADPPPQIIPDNLPANPNQLDTHPHDPTTVEGADVTDQPQNRGDQHQPQNQPNEVPRPLPRSHPDSFQNICRDYLKFKCKYGKYGSNCRFDHPQVCSNLIDHGSKPPYGCNGKQCLDLHPPMCPRSISQQKCDTINCDLWHIKGTRTARQKQRSPANNPSSTQPPPATQSNFCDVRLLKSELQEVMDTRFATLCSELQQQNHQHEVKIQEIMEALLPTEDPPINTPVANTMPQNIHAQMPQQPQVLHQPQMQPQAQIQQLQMQDQNLGQNLKFMPFQMPYNQQMQAPSQLQGHLPPQMIMGNQPPAMYQFLQHLPTQMSQIPFRLSQQPQHLLPMYNQMGQIHSQMNQLYQQPQFCQQQQPMF